MATLEVGNDTLRIKQGDHMITIDAGKSTIQTAKSIELKVGGSSIKIEPAKITLKAPQIAIEGLATVDVMGPKTTVNGNVMNNSRLIGPIIFSR
jgi:type VI secretion system secreted protein VgrG